MMNNMAISIISVNYNCLDWMKLLINSIRKFTAVPYEIIIVDNASEDGSREWLRVQKDIKAIFNENNIGHGRGLDLAIKSATYRYCLVLDVDAHLQRHGWDHDFVKLYSSNPKIKLVAAKGGDPEGKLYNEESARKWVTGNPRTKPIHACFQFFETIFFTDNKLNFCPRNGYDVGRKNYYDVIDLGYEVLRIPAGHEKDKKKFYDGAWGDEYYINGKPTLYHNWYSARMWKKEIVDNLTRQEYFNRKKIIFSHPLVKKILDHGKNLMKDTAILVTTFLRDDYLFRCIESIRKYYPEIAIFIGDNGEPNGEKKKFCQQQRCKLFEFSFDLGVSGVRNESLRLIPKKYTHIVICEDDIIFTGGTKLEDWKKFLDRKKDIGIIGGLLKTDEVKEQHYEANTRIENDAHYIEKIEYPEWKKFGKMRYFLCDLILNVFMIRRTVWEDCQWDNQFKTAFEHSDFFLRIKNDTLWKVAYTPDVWMYHKRDTITNTDYLKYRRRPAGWTLFGKKWNVKYSISSYNRTNPIVFDSMLPDYSIKDENLELAINILNRHKCKWWITAGTCLGAIRENNFIAGDPDIDIGLDGRHTSLWKAFIKEFQEAGFSLYKEWEHKGRKTELSFKRKNIKLDLFFFFHKGKSYWHGVFGPDDKGRWGKNMIFFPNVFSASLFSNLREIFFRGKRCFVPYPTEQYLMERYGEGWRKPDKDYKYWKDCKAIDRNFLRRKKPQVKIETKEVKIDKTRIAIGIKTFLREELLFKTLDAIEEHFPFSYRLYVADDGSISNEKEYKYQKLEENGHVIIRLPFNCGISVGRNEIVKKATEDYVLIMDDDIMIQNSESIVNMKKVLDSDKDIGICSGMLSSKNGDYITNENYQKGLRFKIDRGMLFRYPSERKLYKVDGSLFVYAEQVVNFFLAKRAIFDDVKWDNRIKVEWEHLDFFLQLKNTKWKVAACLNTKAIHMNSIHDSTYNYYRRSVSNNYFYNKHKIHNVINRFQ